MGSIMTLFLNDFEDENEPEFRLKLMNLIECFLFNGADIIIILMIVRVIEMQKQSILDLSGFDIFVYCQR